MNEISTEVTLDAPVDRIWELLSDFALYPEWNPLFPSAAGPVLSGDPFELAVHLPGIDPFRVKPKLVAAEQKSRLCWRSSMLCAPLLSWTFSYELQADLAGNAKFRQKSEFTGVLSPLFSFAMKRPVSEGMELLNQAVKRWGEKGNVRCLRC